MQLQGLALEHRPELEYDLRSRFGFGVDAIDDTVDAADVVLLVRILRQDPSSWVFAATNDWSWPLTHEAIALLSLRDWFEAANVDRSKGDPQQWVRPWDQTPENLPIAEIDALVSAHYSAQGVNFEGVTS